MRSLIKGVFQDDLLGERLALLSFFIGAATVSLLIWLEK